MMKKIKKFSDWFKAKKITASFALISFIGGFLFLNHSITGNIILNNKNSFNIVSLIGLLLILCSVILIAYSIKK